MCFVLKFAFPPFYPPLPSGVEISKQNTHRTCCSLGHNFALDLKVILSHSQWPIGALLKMGCTGPLKFIPNLCLPRWHQLLKTCLQVSIITVPKTSTLMLWNFMVLLPNHWYCSILHSHCPASSGRTLSNLILHSLLS